MPSSIDYRNVKCEHAHPQRVVARCFAQFACVPDYDCRYPCRNSGQCHQQISRRRRRSRCSLPWPAKGKLAEIRNGSGASRLPTIERTDELGRDAELQMRVNTRLARRRAKPDQADLADADLPIETLLRRSDVPTKILIFA